jgi:hypothetical protein
MKNPYTWMSLAEVVRKRVGKISKDVSETIVTKKGE